MKDLEKEKQEKARFFALYYKQDVMRHIDLPESVSCARCYPDILNPSIYNDYWLVLIPLSKISEEDSDHVSRVLREVGENKIDEDFYELIQHIIQNNDLLQELNMVASISIFDYLRSRGYALPYMGISVSEQIDKGWIKLKTK
jgi:hypothetical protein